MHISFGSAESEGLSQCFRNALCDIYSVITCSVYTVASIFMAFCVLTFSSDMTYDAQKRIFIAGNECVKKVFELDMARRRLWHSIPFLYKLSFSRTPPFLSRENAMCGIGKARQRVGASILDLT